MLPIYICAIEDEDTRGLCETLYLRYRQHLFGVAKGILKNDALAEDAVHDCFLSLIDKGSFPAADDKRTRAYLTLITERKALDILRKQKHLADNEPADSELGVSYPFEGSMLASAINSLPQIYRETLLLHYYIGLSTSEIAKMTGIEQKSVLKRLERARQLLKDMLEE